MMEEYVGEEPKGVPVVEATKENGFVQKQKQEDQQVCNTPTIVILGDTKTEWRKGEREEKQDGGEEKVDVTSKENGASFPTEPERKNSLDRRVLLGEWKKAKAALKESKQRASESIQRSIHSRRSASAPSTKTKIPPKAASSFRFPQVSNSVSSSIRKNKKQTSNVAEKQPVRNSIDKSSFNPKAALSDTLRLAAHATKTTVSWNSQMENVRKTLSSRSQTKAGELITVDDSSSSIAAEDQDNHPVASPELIFDGSDPRNQTADDSMINDQIGGSLTVTTPGNDDNEEDEDEEFFDTLSHDPNFNSLSPSNQKVQQTELAATSQSMFTFLPRTFLGFPSFNFSPFTDSKMNEGSLGAANAADESTLQENSNVTLNTTRSGSFSFQSPLASISSSTFSSPSNSFTSPKNRPAPQPDKSTEHKHSPSSPQDVGTLKFRLLRSSTEVDELRRDRDHALSARNHFHSALEQSQNMLMTIQRQWNDDKSKLERVLVDLEYSQQERDKNADRILILEKELHAASDREQDLALRLDERVAALNELAALRIEYNRYRNDCTHRLEEMKTRHEEELERVKFALDVAQCQNLNHNNNSSNDESYHSRNENQITPFGVESTSFEEKKELSKDDSNDKTTILDISPWDTKRLDWTDKPLILTALEYRDTRISDLDAKLVDAERTRRKLHNRIQELRGNIRVYVRVRPFIPMLDFSDAQKQKEGDRSNNENPLVESFEENPKAETKFIPPTPIIALDDGQSLDVNTSGKAIGPSSSGGSATSEDKPVRFSFDRVFNPSSGQEDIFEDVSDFVQSALDGYHVSIFSYGQTGSGKTYTMQGTGNGSMRGIIPRAVRQILSSAQKVLESNDNQWTYTLRASFLEIYNEKLHDLLSTAVTTNTNSITALSADEKTSPSALSIKRGTDGRIFVDGLRWIDIDCHDTEKGTERLNELMHIAAKSRSVSSTAMNDASSRSHAVFTLEIHGEGPNSVMNGSLHLCDLAGSERLSRTANDSMKHLKETQAINKSLSCLGDVFNALANGSPHVPYRNSKLTYLLQDCFGGDGKSLMFVNLSPTIESCSESLCSLRFAQRVNQIELGKARRHVETCK